jgi:hypothetical protein
MAQQMVRGLCALGVAVALLACYVGKADAHPQLVGRWTAATPPGGVTSFIFGPGEFQGHGVWRGPLTVVVVRQLGAASVHRQRRDSRSAGWIRHFQQRRHHRYGEADFYL